MPTKKQRAIALLAKSRARFIWKKGFQSNGISAAVVAAELARLRKRYKVSFLPKDLVLKEFKKPSSPCHGLYNWNVKQAAQKYWLMRTGEIMRAIVTVRLGRPSRRLYAAVTVRRVEHGKRVRNLAYRVMDDALTVAQERKEILKKALDDLRGWVARYQDYASKRGLVRAVDRLLKRMKIL